MVKRWSVTDGQRETHHVSHKQPTNQSRAMQRDTDTTNHMLRGVTQIKPIKSHATSCEWSTQVPDQLSRATHHTLWDRQRYSSCVIALLFPSADNDSVQKWYLLEMSIGQLVVPRYRLTTAGRRAFSCAGPSAWNSLPEYLIVDTLTLDYFKRSLKCVLFARYWHSAWSALGICNDSALYKCTLNNNNNN